MGDEADADWEHGMIEAGREAARPAQRSWWCDQCSVEVYQLRCIHCGKSKRESCRQCRGIEMPSHSWMFDKERRPWVTNSLKNRRNELKLAADRCRKAFTKDYMGEPSNWLADAYEEAANVLDARLSQIETASELAEAADR